MHQGCDNDLSRDFINFGAGDFPFKIPFKSASKLFFFFGSGFGAAISDAVARTSIVFCNSVCADCIVMAASGLLGAAAACVILYCLLQLDTVNRIGMAASRLR